MEGCAVDYGSGSGMIMLYTWRVSCKTPWKIANVAKVIMCFAQGVLWQLILNGWRHWNKSAKFSGKNVGSKIRRWWWGVNGWAIPSARDVSVDFLNV
jgi:hypothetical protein